MEGLTHWLQSLGTANAVLLGAILGAMMCTDMGGPVNKAAYAFGVALLSSSVYAPMAAIMAAGMVPRWRWGWRRCWRATSSKIRTGAAKRHWCWACALSLKGRSVRRPRSDARAALLHCRRGADRCAVDGVRCQLMSRTAGCSCC